MLGLLVGFLTVKVIFVLAAVAFVIQGFRVHWGWGVANIFLCPLSGVAFFLRHRQEARVLMFILAYGVALLLLLLICMSI
jgi:hypothetical protein